MKKTDIFASVIILIAIVVTFYMLGSGTGSASGDFGDKIAVLPLEGVISDSRAFIHTLDDFASRQSVKGIIIAVNSPGGGTTASEEIYLALRRAREKYDKPIFASISTVGASGGYFVALATDVIYAAPTSLTGSIGVIMDLPQWTELMQHIGIDVNRFRSGDLKGAGSPYKTLSEEEKKSFQDLIDNVYERFSSIVCERRHLEPEVLKPLARGQAFTGNQARELGLIDELGPLQSAVDSMATLLKLGDDPKLVYPGNSKTSLFDLVFGDLNENIAKITYSPTLQMIYK